MYVFSLSQPLWSSVFEVLRSAYWSSMHCSTEPFARGCCLLSSSQHSGKGLMPSAQLSLRLSRAITTEPSIPMLPSVAQSAVI